MGLKPGHTTAISRPTNVYCGRNCVKLISPADAIFYARIMNCICAEHKRSINAYYDGGIIAARYAATNATRPVTFSRQMSSCVSGWTKHVNPLRDKSIFVNGSWALL